MQSHTAWTQSGHALRNAAVHAPMLSAQDELELGRRAAGGDQAAFNALVRAHVRLVFAMASEFRSFGVSEDELVSEGLLGLVEGARRFDPERGVRLAAYAAWWIRAYMRRYTLSFRRIVRAPSSRNGRKLLATHNKARRDLWQANGERPDREAVASALGVSMRDLNELESALYGRDVPCGAKVDGRSAFELASEWPSPEALVAEADEQQHSRETVLRAMAQLSERERQILIKRNTEDEPPTLAQLSHQMGISRERVRQLEKRGQERLRSVLLSSVA